MFEAAYLSFLFFMLFQGLINCYLSIYVWENPKRLKQIKSPTTFEPPETTFSLLIPARHEQAVIGQTLTSIMASTYPRDKYEVLVICELGDVETIRVVNEFIDNHQHKNLRLITYTGSPINKPRALNEGLDQAKHSVITIFDAEDEVSPNLLHVINTIYLRKNPDIIQAGVQLMNLHTKWFSVHNVLEYYFWFKSRMQFQIKSGVVPLGGNTVFFKKIQLQKQGGWNQQCLTEDADVGIRLTANNHTCIATYDAKHITKEETPESLSQFIKQRTRWNQGFIQILVKGEWRKYDSWFKKLLCFYTLSFPISQSLSLLATPLILLLGWYYKANILLSLFSFIPLALILIQLVISLVALNEFSREQKMPLSIGFYLRTLATIMPYQFILGFSALRATTREIRGINEWEKTKHAGLHRQRLTTSYEPLISV